MRTFFIPLARCTGPSATSAPSGAACRVGALLHEAFGSRGHELVMASYVDFVQITIQNFNKTKPAAPEPKEVPMIEKHELFVVLQMLRQSDAWVAQLQPKNRI